MVIVPCVCQNNTLGSGCTVLAMEDAIINEIANKCEVDTCEISDQVTDSKEAEGSEDAWVQGRRGYMAWLQRLILCTRRMREERLCGGGCNLWRRCLSQIPAVQWWPPNNNTHHIDGYMQRTNANGPDRDP